ncbi:MAG: RNA polymerase sigma factor [Gemmataceae bacterium]|nr:RNA polymerase sigma factor [Gemmataceae bacterium]MCS7270784.1 RNA polymerase sigma factor [Gemmataceae bacterium]MDW8244369.1 RNA polymerase sigma factor [Thermogemmata sp.]
MAPAAVYQQLVADYYEALYRFAYRLSGSDHDARDLVQETYRRAFEAIHQLRDARAARSWLIKILLNVYRQQYRQEAGLRYCPPESLTDQQDTRGEPQDTAFDGMPSTIDPQRLQQAILELDEMFRLPLLLFYMEDYSYRDIAEQLSIPLGTVMSRLSRAKEHLRRRLQAATAKPLGSVGEGRNALS